jgi:cation:H+ antiporter
MILTYALFVVGFVLLIKGADWLVEGAAAFARKLGISPLVIGLTIVSLGTSAPELVVNVVASFEGSSGLAVGNVLGSNISNIMLILGVTAAIYPVRVQASTRIVELPFSVLCTLLLGLLANDQWIDGAERSILSRSDGLAIMAYFLVFMAYSVYISRLNPAQFEEEVSPRPVWRSLAMVVGGGVALTLGGDWIVEGARSMALSLGMTETAVGLTVVAIGTSLPELAASVTAARKRQADIAVGNVVGSNIFNLLWILGLSASIKPLPFAPASNLDILVLLLVSAALFGGLFAGTRYVITRPKGVALVVGYTAYLVFTLAANQ